MTIAPSEAFRSGPGCTSRRRWLRIAGGAAAGVALGPVARAGAESGLPSGPAAVTFWDSASALKARLYRETLLPAYRQARPGYSVTYEQFPTVGLPQKLAVATAAGTGPEIFELGDWFLPTYVGRGRLDAVPPEAFGYPSLPALVDGYLPGSLAAMLHEGRLYGLPDFMASHSLFINNRLFEASGLDPVKDAPRTWADVARLNRILTRRQGGRIVQKGFEMRYVDEHWLARTFHHLVYQAGGDVLDAAGRPVFNREPGVRALEVWKSVTVAPEVSRNTSASPFHDFATEQDAMSYIGPNGGRQSESINPRMKGNYTVVPLPQIDPARPATMAFSYVIVVNAAAPAPSRRVAWDFVRHALSDPRPWLANNGALLPQKGWAGSPEARRLLPFYDVFMHDIAIGRPLARTRHYAELQAALARMIERVVLGGADPKRSLDEAAAEFERATRG